MSNPFEIKGYYINESIYIAACNDNTSPSRITFTDNTIPKILIHSDPSLMGFVKSGPMNLLDLEKYIINENSKLMINLQLAKLCDDAGLKINKDQRAIFPSECTKTFQNFSKQYLTNLKNNIITEGANYTSQILSDSNPYKNFAYTSEYISSKKTPNDWKPLCQRYNDILQMLNDYSIILSSIQKTSNNYNDQYIQLLKMYKDNDELRKRLENKLEIVTQGEYYKNSKDFLDSTIYVSVLWTILATTFLFFIFKKM